MLLYGLVGIVANLAVLVGLAFVLSRTVPRLPKNKLYRFAFLLIVWVPVNFVINFINVQTRGFHKMSWTGAFIIALILAAFQTLLSSQSHNSNTP
jgi:predicted tellurium resistance membrane protein TerC